MKQKVADLETLAAVKGSIEPEGRHAASAAVPRRVGRQAVFPSSRASSTQLTTKYTMFDDGGTPLRATCTVQLQEADTLSTKDAEHRIRTPAPCEQPRQPPRHAAK